MVDNIFGDSGISLTQHHRDSEPGYLGIFQSYNLSRALHMLRDFLACLVSNWR